MSPIGFLVDDDRLHNAAVRKNGTLKLLRRRRALGVLLPVSGDVECKRNLVVRWLANVVLQEATDARIRLIELHRIDGQKCEFAGLQATLPWRVLTNL